MFNKRELSSPRKEKKNTPMLEHNACEHRQATLVVVLKMMSVSFTFVAEERCNTKTASKPRRGCETAAFTIRDCYPYSCSALLGSQWDGL